MESAQTAYATAAADISSLVSELQTLADELHDVDADAINWGNVGDLGRVKAALELSVSIFRNKG